MQYGGYLAVSSKLGVRIQKVKEKSGPKQGYRDDGGVQFTADDAEDSKANVVLSAQAKEDKMAADLARLARAAARGRHAVATLALAQVVALARGKPIGS